MSEWITNRRPTLQDCTADSPAGGKYNCVYDAKGMLVNFWTINEGEAWKPVPKCEPYVGPKRYFVALDPDDWRCFYVKDTTFNETWATIRVPISNHPHEESRLATIRKAERIAAIYEEVIP